MPTTRTFFRSFAGGELSPEMFGRLDDVKFQTGAAKLLNFIATPQGPAENRPGTRFVKAVNDSTKKTRIIPFTYSTTQTMVLETGTGYFRFHTQSATLGPGTPSAYSTTKTISAVNIGTETFTSNAHGYANGTPVQVSATTTLPAPLVAATTYYVINAAANTYQLSMTATGSAIDITTTGSGTITTNQVYSVGGLVSSGGVNYYCIATTAGNTPPNATYWYPMPAGIYEIPTPYAEDDLFGLHYVQSGDVLTIVHPNYAPRELRRLGATTWVLSTILFASPIPAPDAPTVTANRGRSMNITAITNAAIAVITTASDHNLSDGDPIEISGVVGMTEANGFWIVHKSTPPTKLEVQAYATGVLFDSTNPPVGAWTSGGSVQYANQSQDIDNYYVITSIASNGLDESVASPVGTVSNNLNVTGASNDLTWTAVPGALRYNVYKRQSGLYGYIGQTSTNAFTDDNIAPDMGITPPIVDTVFASAGNYPQAVSYFEQRRVFAGTNNEPQTMWMTRSGTESDMSYSLPIKDDDRVNIRVAAREANTIRHVVPLNQLLLLTSAAEWRVSPINSDAITPTTVSVRPQSYVGANNVQPEIINNSMVYCAARGGHVRELGYSWQSSGFVTGDLSIRSAHLFDNYTISDMCFAKSPQPLLWFVSSTGKLLGLTYIPEQQIGAWHQHETDGIFESCCVVAEGIEDALYVIVRRTVNGNSVRYVERMETRQITTLEDSFFVDAGLTYDGNNTGATTVTVTGGTTWGPADSLTITSSASLFVWPGTTDVNDAIVLTDALGNKYRLKILATSSALVATAKVDKVIPVALRATPTAVWAFARDSVGGLTHLEGKTVSILGDGAVMPQAVVTGGVAVLSRSCVKIQVGLPYNSDLQTLPVAINIEAFGQGRVKNVNQAWIRVFQSSGIFIGPDENKLTEAKQRTFEPYGSPPSLKSDEVSVLMTPTWAQSGQIYMRQSDPLPLTVVGITTEVVVGS